MFSLGIGVAAFGFREDRTTALLRCKGAIPSPLPRRDARGYYDADSDACCIMGEIVGLAVVVLVSAYGGSTYTLRTKCLCGRCGSGKFRDMGPTTFLKWGGATPRTPKQKSGRTDRI